MNHWFGDERSMFVIVEPRKPFNKRRMEGYFALKIGKFGKGYRNLEEDLEGLLWIMAKRGVRATVLEI